MKTSPADHILQLFIVYPVCFKIFKHLKILQIKYAGSEVHLNEILENVCNHMDDYAQAKNKDSGELILINLAKDVEKLSTHELVQDPDLNRSLKYYVSICNTVKYACLVFIIKHFDLLVTLYLSKLEIFFLKTELPLNKKSQKKLYFMGHTYSFFITKFNKKFSFSYT